MKKRQVFPVTIDFKLAPFQMVAVGDYQWIAPNVLRWVERMRDKTKSGTVLRNLVIFRLPLPITPEDAAAKIKVQGFEPATPEELLAFGEQHQDADVIGPIVALGTGDSLPSGERQFLCISSNGHGFRRLRVELVGAHGKFPHQCFLAAVSE